MVTGNRKVVPVWQIVHCLQILKQHESIQSTSVPSYLISYDLYEYPTPAEQIEEEADIFRFACIR